MQNITTQCTYFPLYYVGNELFKQMWLYWKLYDKNEDCPISLDVFIHTDDRVNMGGKGRDAQEVWMETDVREIGCGDMKQTEYRVY
jgi:hypothetical protein